MARLRYLQTAILSLLLLQAGQIDSAVVPREPATQPGFFSVRSTNPLEFKYSTSEPDSQNWIGVYHPSGGGPDNGVKAEDSLKWSYATQADGVLQLSTDGLATGSYKAYFLAKNGYKWLSEPVYFALGENMPGTLSLASTKPLKFDYKTSKSGSKNWIGLYFASAGGPENGVFDQPSIRWSYAPGAHGSVEFDNDGLGSGQYKAYFLADDKYESLSAPVQFALGDAGKLPGSVSADYSRAPLNIKYTTTQSNDKNWIGLYHADGGGPENQVQDQPALTWNWAPKSIGEITLSIKALNPGAYKVFFLANGGYKWVSEPVVVRVRNSAPFSFIVNSITTKNARQGDRFEASLENLVSQPGDVDTKFTVTRGGDWATISPSGVISGTPPPGAKDTTLQVEAKNANGAIASVAVRIPVKPAGSSLVDQLRVLTFNLWHGGTQVTNYHEKQVRFLVDKDVDIAGFQESTGGHGTRLARALGWYSWQGPDVSIISRYPITQVFSATSMSGSVKISLDGSRSEIVVWNAHLGYDPYGPYDFCFDRMSVSRVMEREAQSGRTPQIQEITQKMGDHLSNAGNVPVFLLGDFNAPSHLDWTGATKSQHCNVGDVPWPTSKYPTDAGLIDSFRVAYSDPGANPGITWSPIYLNNNGRAEPLDRIDFVYHKGRKLSVQGSEALVVGNPTPEPNHGNNEWTSDHKAVLTTYRITL
ncbi:exonuclease III [Pochonia chlamydosporia 170]|uniref:Exonuclease III n=1 Tax=Pochonia chlamydosporia 170 TaxID=1380566 RepID=A0A179FW91_METCM|nr:exonuclease III [Pochonia chlamydosporia 170]OAQ69637.1 exonuclease III [Pochonia chlamydosporia 170]